MFVGHMKELGWPDVARGPDVAHAYYRSFRNLKTDTFKMILVLLFVLKKLMKQILVFQISV